jgi:Rps23 Pro-64 3,4-dihydroxylase Tpa1-like proline 4-hydroxylase
MSLFNHNDILELLSNITELNLTKHDKTFVSKYSERCFLSEHTDEPNGKLAFVYHLTKNWNPDWGGGLELWSHDDQTGKAKQMEQLVINKFNRAVLFDTTQNSWHGLPAELSCPEGVVRQSIATYYVTEPEPNADPRGKALFVPYKDQAQDPDILELIKKRSQVATAESVYKGLK